MSSGTRQLTPLSPIFRRPKMTGAIEVGTTPSTCVPAMSLTSVFTSGTTTLPDDLSASGGVLNVAGAKADNTGDRFVTIDISDPASMSQLGQLDDPFVFAKGQYVSGSTLFARVYDGVGTIDISTPASPAFLDTATGTYATHWAAGFKLYPYGNYAIDISVYVDRLNVVDGSTPGALSIVGTVQDGANLDFPMALAIDGTYAYVACRTTLATVDLSTPSAPAIVGTVALPSHTTRQIFIDGTDAVVIDSGQNHVVDISTPTAPSLTSSNAFAHGYTGRSIARWGEFLLFADFSGSPTKLNAVDYTDPTTPTLAAELSDSTFDDFQNMIVEGNVAYCLLEDASAPYWAKVAAVDLSGLAC